MQASDDTHNNTAIATAPAEPCDGSARHELIESLSRGHVTVDKFIWPILRELLEMLRTDDRLANLRKRARRDAQEGLSFAFPFGSTSEQKAAYRIAFAEEQERLLFDPE